MTGYIRIKSPWAQLGIFFLVFLPQFFLLLISLMIDTDTKMDLTNPSVVSELKWWQAISSIAFFLLPAFLYAVACFRSHYGYFLGLKKAQRQNMFVLAVICIMLSFPLVYWFGALNEQIPMPEWMTSLEQESSEQLEAFLKVNQPLDIVINLIVIALLPAFCEEMFFRGALQRIMIQLTRNPWAGIIITAILFSALHLQFLGFLPRMFMGIVLGAFYWYSGSLWTSIAAHFVYNGVQVVAVAYYPTWINSNPEMPMLTGVVSGIAVAAILWYFRRQSTITYAKVYGE